MENAIGMEDMTIARYLIDKGMKINKKLMDYVKRCNEEFEESFVTYVNKKNLTVSDTKAC